MSLAPHQPSSRYRRMRIRRKWGEKDERSLASSRRLLARDGGRLPSPHHHHSILEGSKWRLSLIMFCKARILSYLKIFELFVHRYLQNMTSSWPQLPSAICRHKWCQWAWIYSWFQLTLYPHDIRAAGVRSVPQSNKPSLIFSDHSWPSDTPPTVWREHATLASKCFMC